MRRYWINKSQISNDQVSFTNEQFHHIFSVCRQVVGQHFEVITEDGKAFLAEVVSVEKKQAFAKIIETRMIQKLKTPHLHIALSISRFNVMDSLIERCVEMGVSSFTPFYSDFSFIHGHSGWHWERWYCSDER